MTTLVAVVLMAGFVALVRRPEPEERVSSYALGSHAARERQCRAAEERRALREQYRRGK